uniref:Uncharacterized protein n=2 Tax=Magallana gigas TaxID=29159 RepID=A0A8W8KAS7_MAGGI
ATPMKNSQSLAPSSGFNFGTPQNNSATPNQSTPAKPYDFSQSLTPSFNFGAGGGNNVSFGTPGGNGIPQPSFGGSTPSFNVGTGNNQKARPVRKPVRRTKRT